MPKPRKAWTFGPGKKAKAAPTTNFLRSKAGRAKKAFTRCNVNDYATSIEAYAVKSV